MSQERYMSISILWQLVLWYMLHTLFACTVSLTSIHTHTHTHTHIHTYTHVYTQSHTHTSSVSTINRGDEDYDFLLSNEDVCVWYFPHKLWDIMYQTVDTQCLDLNFQVQPWTYPVHVIYQPIFNIPVHAKICNLQPFAPVWTMPILKFVHILNVECRNDSMFNTPFNCL